MDGFEIVLGSQSEGPAKNTRTSESTRQARTPAPPMALAFPALAPLRRARVLAARRWTSSSPA